MSVTRNLTCKNLDFFYYWHNEYICKISQALKHHEQAEINTGHSKHKATHQYIFQHIFVLNLIFKQTKSMSHLCIRGDSYHSSFQPENKNWTKH